MELWVCYIAGHEISEREGYGQVDQSSSARASAE